MLKRIPAFAVAVAALAIPFTSAAVAAESRQIRESFDLEPGQRVVVDFPIGSLELEAWDGAEVEVEIEARCRRARRRCGERLEDLRLRSRSRADRLDLEVEAKRSWSGSDLEIEAVVRVPRRAALTVDMGIGELEVAGFENDVRIDMGIGEVEVRMVEAAVRSVSLDAGIGESSLDLVGGEIRERRKLLVGSELSWDDGDGSAELEVELGIGEISVDLG